MPARFPAPAFPIGELLAASASAPLFGLDCHIVPTRWPLPAAASSALLDGRFRVVHAEGDLVLHAVPP